MNLLVITQDLRISGTSAGIGRRSFITKLKKAYPNSVLNVLYLTHFKEYNEQLDLLPVQKVTRKIISRKIPFLVKWINRFSTRLFNYLYADNHIHSKYARELKKIEYDKYDHIFVTSSGTEHETILACYNLPVLKKATIIFHDPYPYAWYKADSQTIHKNEFLRLNKMIKVVQQAKVCCATAFYMAKDLQYLYASNKKFYTIPHHFDVDCFNLEDKKSVRNKNATIQISYHGALMFGRDAFTLLEAYSELIKEDAVLKVNTEFVFRVKGDRLIELKQKFGSNDNIHILEPLDFSNSFTEQLNQSDINVILENGPHYSNVLPGKVPVLDWMKKPVLILSPERSELRRLLAGNTYNIAAIGKKQDIKLKMKRLFESLLAGKRGTKSVFGNYFSEHSFKENIDSVIDF